MSLTTLYKPGQGYWTRMLTAVGGAVLLLAGAEWTWQQLSLIQRDWVIYVQAAAAVLIVAAGAFVLYRYVALKPRSADFLIATEGEMRKVNWPTRREVTGFTWVVVAFLVLFVTLLFLSDLLFATFFQWIDVLDVKPEMLPPAAPTQ